MRRTPRRHSGSFQSFELQPRATRFVAADAAGASHRGRDRSHNEDRFLVQDPVFVVADGVGGQAGGGHAAQVASRQAAHCAGRIARVLQLNRTGTDPETAAALRRIPARCQAQLRNEAVKKPELARMATTLTFAVVDWPTVHVISVGDSPCFHLRGTDLTRVTVEQTMARQLADAGALSEREVEISPLRHMLASAVSAGELDAEAHARRIPLRMGDALILCTDGVSRCVPPDRLAGIVGGATTAQQACHDILADVRRTPCGDDATVIVVRFPGPALRRPSH